MNDNLIILEDGTLYFLLSDKQAKDIDDFLTRSSRWEILRLLQIRLKRKVRAAWRRGEPIRIRL